MKIRLKTKAMARVAGAALLLSAALAAWGINITLSDGTSSVTCPISAPTTIATNGDITTTVASSCITTGGGGGGGGTGPLTLTVTKQGNGAGTVTGTGFSCGADCTESYPDGTAISVTLTAAADAGSTFTGWSGACTGITGNACTVVTTITSNLSVAANFTADTPPAGACGNLPADVTVVDTGNLNVAWRQQTFFPLPQTVMAFKVTAPAGFAGRDTFTVTKTSVASRSKRLVVSTCPGVLTPVNGQAACSYAALEATSISVSLNSADPSYYCKLTPGATYYVNAVSKVNLTDTAYTCTNTNNCSFYASRSAPF